MAIPGLDGMAVKHSAAGHPTRKHHAKKSGNQSVLWITAGVGVTALAFAAIIAMVAMNSTKQGAENPVAASPVQSQPAAPAAPPKPTRPTTLLVLTWPESERADAAVFVDGSRREVPKTGPVEYPLEVQPGSYKIYITRKGFQRLEFSRLSHEGDQLPPYPVRWIPNYDNWGQDFDEAKQASAGGKKQILIVFDGSDWAPKSERLMREIFSRRSFSRWPSAISC